MHSRPIPLTDDRGRLFVPSPTQPEPGSVVLTNGPHGTAWQLFFSDGRWHPTRGGGSKSWTEMLTKTNLVLIYDAEVRETSPTGRLTHHRPQISTRAPLQFGEHN